MSYGVKLRDTELNVQERIISMKQHTLLLLGKIVYLIITILIIWVFVMH